MDENRLDRFPGSYYLGQFKAENIKVLPYREAGFYSIENDEYTKVGDSCGGKAYRLCEQPSQGMIVIDVGEDSLLEFEMYLPAENGTIAKKYVGLAKEVLVHLPVLDAMAREIPSGFDHKEELAYIQLKETAIELRYFATAVNTEWSVYFERQADDVWVFKSFG